MAGAWTTQTVNLHPGHVTKRYRRSGGQEYEL
jgi:hypothetical protein